MADRLRPILKVFLIGIGVFTAGIKLGENKKLALIGCLAILAAFELQTAFAAGANDRWTNVGKSAISPAYLELTDWVRSNTNVNDVFIATNEDSFMFNALTGRKTVVYRLTHASPYSDMYGRMRDQAVIVYGNNDNERTKLLKKYNVKYVLWTAYWLPNEFRFDNEGHVVGFVDPLLVPRSSDYSSYWNSNGVHYIQNKMTPDPAPRTGVPLYDLLVAYPPSPSMDQPYSSDFAKHLKLIKEIQEQGRPFFRIYQFDTN